MLRASACCPARSAAARWPCGDLPEPFLGNPGANGRHLWRSRRRRGSRCRRPPTRCCPTRRAGSSPTRLPPVCRRRRCRRSPTRCGRTTGSWSPTAEQRGGTVVPVFTRAEPEGRGQGQHRGTAGADRRPGPPRRPATAGPGRDARPRRRSPACSPASRRGHARRSEQPVQPRRQGADCHRDRRARRRQRVADQADEGASHGARPGGAGRAPTAPTSSCRAMCAWCRSPAASSGWRSSGSVKAPSGDERGKVVQLNDIPAGSLDHYWADVAVVVATEAAGGVNDVIARQSGREPGDEPVHGQAGEAVGRRPHDPAPSRPVR